MKYQGWVILASLTLTACSSTQKLENKYKVQIEKLHNKISKQAGLVKQLKEENEILKIKNQKVNNKLVATKKVASIKDGTKLSEKELAASGKLGETKLFGSFISYYTQGEKDKYMRAVMLLEKAYPKSQYLAEANLLLGKGSLGQKEFKMALKYFNRVVKDHKKSDQYKTALLGKAITYRRMALIKPAESILNNLIKRFPQSNEAAKAKVHLSLLQQLK